LDEVKDKVLEMSRDFPHNVCMADTKSTRLDMRVSEGEKELFQKAAEQDGRPLSNWIRDRLLKAARVELKDGKGKR
jgi:uncharacterized protein (DUF1778 family)